MRGIFCFTGFVRLSQQPGRRAPAKTAGVPRSQDQRALILSTMSSGQSLARSEARRSEEHTSELQSLMRISYAVFCLKKKKQTIPYSTQLSTTRKTHAIN